MMENREFQLPSDTDPRNLCEMFDLCPVRLDDEGKQAKVGVKRLDGTQEEWNMADIISREEIELAPIHKIYSSGHVFLSGDQKYVYLVGVQKDENGPVQYQFTGGSPKEENVADVFTEDGKVKLDMIEDNAKRRTENRTGVAVTEHFNKTPYVDWVFMESEDEHGERYWKMILLMHYVVKNYKGELTAQVGKEDVVDAGWFSINELENRNDIAPNAKVIVDKAINDLFQ